MKAYVIKCVDQKSQNFGKYFSGYCHWNENINEAVVNKTKGTDVYGYKNIPVEVTTTVREIKEGE